MTNDEKNFKLDELLNGPRFFRAPIDQRGYVALPPVPNFCGDIAVALEAESRLPKDRQSYYLECLSYAVGLEFENGHVDSVATEWKTRRATPEQMVGAMLAALESAQVSP